jgi:WD40 repeat protein
MAWIGNDLIVAAEIDNPILSVWKFEIDKWILHSELCMNLSPMDPRTAYTTLAMAWNSQSRILAACTDRNSVLLFSLAENFGSQQGNHMCPVKTLYGMSLGAYDNPNIEFSLDGSHVYITSDRRILVFELRSGHNVFDIMVSESKAIRCMRRHADLDILATVSFDRCLSIIR